MAGEYCTCPKSPYPICHTATSKQLLSDRNETKLIERICQLRENHPNLKVGEIQRPLVVREISDGVYEVEVEF